MSIILNPNSPPTPNRATVDLNDPFQLIGYARILDVQSVMPITIYHPKHPDSSTILRVRNKTRPIPPNLRPQLEKEAAAKGESAPTHMVTSTMLIAIPHDLAQSYRGEDSASMAHPMWLMVVHRGMYDQLAKQAESGIVTPATSSLIVR